MPGHSTPPPPHTQLRQHVLSHQVTRSRTFHPSRVATVCFLGQTTDQIVTEGLSQSTSVIDDVGIPKFIRQLELGTRALGTRKSHSRVLAVGSGLWSYVRTVTLSPKVVGDALGRVPRLKCTRQGRLKRDGTRTLIRLIRIGIDRPKYSVQRKKT